MHACTSQAGVSPQPLPGSQTQKAEARVGNGAWAQSLSCRDTPARLHSHGHSPDPSVHVFLCRLSSSLISQHTAHYCTFPFLSLVAPPVLPCAGVEEPHSLRTRVSLSQTQLTSSEVVPAALPSPAVRAQPVVNVARSHLQLSCTSAAPTEWGNPSRTPQKWNSLLSDPTAAETTCSLTCAEPGAETCSFITAESWNENRNRGKGHRHVPLQHVVVAGISP